MKAAKIALIEDNDTVIELLTFMFSTSEYELDVYKSPDSYIPHKGQHRWIISDWCFGGVNLDEYEELIDTEKLVLFSGSSAIKKIKHVAYLDKGGDSWEILSCLRKLENR
jgi:FixJ family two-component response regulator